jgi:hypothetical protein
MSISPNYAAFLSATNTLGSVGENFDKHLMFCKRLVSLLIETLPVSEQNPRAFAIRRGARGLMRADLLAYWGSQVGKFSVAMRDQQERYAQAVKVAAGYQR